MRATFFETLTTGSVEVGALSRAGSSWPRRAALAAIVALAAALRFANLQAVGYVNHYYTAAVASMLQSWHNFFFVAAEPGGSVSVDKPPVGLWLETASAYVFGVNGFAVLLPQILAGILSVVLLYHLIRRSFGTMAGLLAALALAITPVFVATNRNNTIDSTLILALLLAAWAFIKATESGKLRFLLLGAALVGIGFNIKMLEAYLPLPAFYALYFLGANVRFWRKLGNLALATVLLVAVSFSWATAVDLTPADQRPYVGSSGDNSVMSLAIGYNGVERLLGMGGRGGLLSGLLGGASQQAGTRGGGPGAGPNNGNSRWNGTGPNGTVPQNGLGGNDGFTQPGNGRNGASQPGGNGGNVMPFQPGANGTPNLPFQPNGAGQQFAPGGRGGFGGMGDTGRAGPLRLFTAPLGKETSWLLPLGLFGAGLLAFGARPRWPLALKHQTLVLWGGWLVVGGAFFSVAGFFHQYYLSTLAPPVAGLAAIAVASLWQLRARSRWLSIVLLLAAAATTLWLQVTTAGAFVSTLWWLPIVVGLVVVGAALLVALARWQPRLTASVGFACVVAALLVTPGVWSYMTMLSTASNQSLPAAYDGRSVGPENRGYLQVDQGLLSFLQAHTQGVKYLMAVPSSMQGADYVLATGRPVLYLGGFSGQDQVESSSSLAKLVADGELRYIYWSGGRGGGFGGQQAGQSDVSSWVTTQCKVVDGYETATQNAGAPDGTSGGQPGGLSADRDGMQVSLYDCSGAKP